MCLDSLILTWPKEVMTFGCSPQVYKCLYTDESYCFAYFHLCVFRFNQFELKVTSEKKFPYTTAKFSSTQDIFRAADTMIAENLAHNL